MTVKVWLNGTVLSAGEVRLDPADRGLLLGDGVFETILAVDGSPRALEAHLARLESGAATLGIPLPLGTVAIVDGIADVLHWNALTKGRAALRVTLTRGPAPRGVAPPENPSPTLLITGAASPEPASALATVIARETRRNEHSPLSRIKSTNYLDAIIARREAAARGVDDALLLNTQGRLAEATAANLFIVEGDRIVTPDEAEGALPGIARAMILERAAQAGLEAQRSTVTARRLLSADGAFLTNSLVGIVPLSAVDGEPLPQPATVLDRLRPLLDS